MFYANLTESLCSFFLYMSKEIKDLYVKPELKRVGSVAGLTAALGSGSREDQSDFPGRFPPSTGSFDVCHNNSPDTTC